MDCLYGGFYCESIVDVNDGIKMRSETTQIVDVVFRYIKITRVKA